MVIFFCIIYLNTQNAVRSIKPIVKNLSEMDKELELISQVSAVGDLRIKLAEAEEAKVEVEAILLERVRNLLNLLFSKKKSSVKQMIKVNNIFQIYLLNSECFATRDCRRMGTM